MNDSIRRTRSTKTSAFCCGKCKLPIAGSDVLAKKRGAWCHWQCVHDKPPPEPKEHKYPPTPPPCPYCGESIMPSDVRAGAEKRRHKKPMLPGDVVWTIQGHAHLGCRWMDDEIIDEENSPAVDIYGNPWQQ